MKRESQSYRLNTLFSKGKVVTLEQMAAKLGVDRSLVQSYVAEFVRVYGAKIKHEPRTTEWRMLNKVDVPQFGRAGKHVVKAKQTKAKAKKARRKK